MSVTIDDIAKLAGVSKATVSRVINDKGLISEETKNKILKIMQEYNYYPNSMARSFANRSSFSVGLLVDVDDTKAYSNPYFLNSIFGIETVVHKAGYNLIISNERELNGNLTSSEKLVLEKKIDGLILPTSIINKNLLKKLNDRKFPFVVIGEPAMGSGNVNWVDINNKQGGEQAVQFLIKKGYKNIAFISGSQKELFNINRYKGYVKGLEANGYHLDESYVKVCDITVESGFTETSKLLRLENPPDAIVCGGDLLAVGAVKAARSKGLNIPRDFGIISFDNSAITEHFEPSITAVDVDTFALGEHAATILMQCIERHTNSAQLSMISTKIIERESTSRKE